MYRCLITGSSGFVGGHLMKYLGSLSYEVDTISKQEFMNEDFRRLDSFKLETALLAGSIDSNGNEHELVEIGNIGTPDIVIHCAWPKLDLHSTDHLEFAEMSCNFFNECKARGIRVINIGSSSEYGVKYEPMKEDMICEPINTYGIAKLMVTLYAKKLGFNTLRLFTVIGEGGHSFFDNNKTEKWEYPNSTREPVHIKIVCKAIERLMHAEHLYGEVINVGSGKPVRYRNSTDGEIDLNDKKMKWFKYPQSQYEPSDWRADITKMRKLLNI